MKQRNKRRRLAEGEQYVTIGEREFHVENICFAPSNGSLAMTVDTTRLVQRGSSGHIWVETLRGVEFYPKTLAEGGKSSSVGIAGNYIRGRDNAVKEALHVIATQPPVLMGGRTQDGHVFQGIDPETGEPLYVQSVKEIQPIEAKPVKKVKSKGIIEAYLSTRGKLRTAVEKDDPAIRAAFKAIKADALAVAIDDKTGTLLVSRHDAPLMRNPGQVEEYVAGLKKYVHKDAHIATIDELKALWQHRNQGTLRGTFNSEAFYLSSTAIQANAVLGVCFADGEEGNLNSFGPYQRRAVLTVSRTPEN